MSNQDISILPVNHQLDNDRYTIIKKLGQGGFGIAYKVSEKNLTGKYKYKVIKELFIRSFCYRTREKDTVFPEPKNRNLFKRFKEDIQHEVDTLSNIKNINIVQIYGSFSENNTIYTIMELIEGDNLKELLDTREKFTEKEAKDLFIQLANGLKDIHSMNIIHRDIKPSNIMRTDNNIFKIIDFTNIKTFTESEIDVTGIGTEGYAPPEIKLTRSTIGIFSDIYSIGMTLYYCLSKDKELPSALTRKFDNDDNNDILKEKINRLNISNNLKKILIKMTELKIEDRYQSLQEIREDLNKNDIKEFSLELITTPKKSEIEFMDIDKEYYHGIKLKKGIYEIEIFKDGYETEIIKIDLQQDTSKSLSLKKKKQFHLTINCTPNSAKVNILNSSEEYCDGILLKENIYHIKISKNGYLSKKININLYKNTTKDFILEKSFNYLLASLIVIILSSALYFKDSISSLFKEEPRKEEPRKEEPRKEEPRKVTWQDNSDVEYSEKIWEDANQYCKQLNLNGLKWELPNKRDFQMEDFRIRNKDFLHEGSKSVYWANKIPYSIKVFIYDTKINKNGKFIGLKKVDQKKRYNTRCIHRN